MKKQWWTMEKQWWTIVSSWTLEVHEETMVDNEETMVDKIAQPGVTKYTNFAFRDQGVEVTQGYKIDIPKFFSYDVLLKKNRPQSATNYVISADYSRPHVLAGAIDQTAKMSVVITCTESTVSMLKNRR